MGQTMTAFVFHMVRYTDREGEEHDPKALGRDLRLKLESFPELSGTYLEHPGKGSIVEGELESKFSFAERSGEEAQVFECTTEGASEPAFYLKPVLNNGSPEGFSMSYPSLPKMHVTFVYPKLKQESTFSKFMSKMNPKRKILSFRMNSMVNSHRSSARTATAASAGGSLDALKEEPADEGSEAVDSPLPPRSPKSKRGTKKGKKKNGGRKSVSSKNGKRIKSIPTKVKALSKIKKGAKRSTKTSRKSRA